jgi:hypothetical protein
MGNNVPYEVEIEYRGRAVNGDRHKVHDFYRMVCNMALGEAIELHAHGIDSLRAFVEYINSRRVNELRESRLVEEVNEETLDFRLRRVA